MSAWPSRSFVSELVYGGASVTLALIRLYHKLRRHESWHSLEGHVAAAVDFLYSPECRYNAGIRLEANARISAGHEEGIHDEPA